MGLGSEMHDRVDPFGDEEIIDQIRTRDVAMYELEILRRLGWVEILEVGAIIEFIEHHDLIVRVVTDQSVRHMRCDESGGPRDENVLRNIG